MRAKDFISEAGKGRRTKIRADSLNAIPGMHYHPQTDFYHMYRMGVVVASMPKGPHKDHKPFGPTENFPVTLNYSDEEAEMTKNASKFVGIKHEQITTPHSHETDDVGKMSPVAQWMKKSKK